MDNFNNKRRYERIFFGRDQNIVGQLSLPDGETDGPQVTILNLSEGGLHFTITRRDHVAIKDGERILLKSVSGPPPLKFARPITMEVKWVLDHDFLEHIGYGCEFIDLPEELAEMIRDVVASGNLGSKG